MAFGVSMQPERNSSPTGVPHTGAILLGGAHGALALARNFGRNGIPVVLVTDDHPLPKFSRYVQRRFDWPGASAAETPRWLVQLAEREGLRNWLLVPCGDGEAKLIASNLELLRSAFRVESCDWERLRTLCDKQMLAQSAAAAGIAAPRAYRLRSEADAASLDIAFPVVLKPAMRTARNAFTQAKAWQADNREELIALYREAAKLVGYENVVVQELIPGGGEAQLSYAALWHRGKPVAEIVAQRTRQFPIDFSYTSTFVEVIVNDKVKAAATALLTPIAFEGMVEVEFKFDARDQQCAVRIRRPRHRADDEQRRRGRSRPGSEGAARPCLDAPGARRRRHQPADDARAHRCCRLPALTAAEARVRVVRLGRPAARPHGGAADDLARRRPFGCRTVSPGRAGEDFAERALTSFRGACEASEPGIHNPCITEGQ
jgi:D-aspartate ligase